MIIDNKKLDIGEENDVKKYNNNELKVILKGINKVTNISWMFYR